MGDFRRASPFFAFLVTVSRPVVRGLFRLRAIGLEHVPHEGGIVVASNHVSNLDPWPLGLPLYPRQIHYMAKAELYRNAVLGWVLEKGEAFPVRRGGA
jgi:1-acyl-sn-glycerol-3-phosphate acyltransferase